MGMNVLTSGTTESSNFHAAIEVLVTTHNKEINDLKRRMRSLEDEVEALRKDKIELQGSNQKAQDLLNKYNTKLQLLKSKYEKSKSISSSQPQTSVQKTVSKENVESKSQKKEKPPEKEKTPEKAPEIQTPPSVEVLTLAVKPVPSESKKRKSAENSSTDSQSPPIKKEALTSKITPINTIKESTSNESLSEKKNTNTK